MRTLSKSKLKLIEQKLLDMKALELAQLDELEKELMQLSDNTKDENGDDSYSYSLQFDKLVISKSRLRKHIKQIENALLRIENNCYGICAETGQAIAIKRLMAVPTTTLSMEGKQLRAKRN